MAKNLFNEQKRGSAVRCLQLVAAAFCCCLLAACTRPAEQKKPAETPKHVYKNLKPDIYPVPEAVKQALPGLQNDNIYVYREIAPTLNLVAYVPDYSLAGAMKMAARAFVALTDNPEFRRGIDFWIIQVQPAAAKAPAKDQDIKASQKKPEAKVMVWGVRPSEVDVFKKSGDLMYFIVNSEYLLVNDKIIAKGNERKNMFAPVLAPNLKGASEHGGPPPAQKGPGIKTGTGQGRTVQP